MKSSFYPFLFFILFLSGCSLTSQKSNHLVTDIPKTITERNQQMAALSRWGIKGKIAFIQPDKRESANIFWQHENPENQQLNLTTYLGINVLQLMSLNGLHTIEVDGESYQGHNLADLIYQLTHLQLPTEALQFWLKGLPYSHSDILTYDTQTQLPNLLISQFNGHQWKISYQEYKTYNQHQLATKFTLNQGNLTIKISINLWNV